MKEIFIMLTRSPSLLSRSIQLATNDFYTHSSMAFDKELSTLCSFGRKVYYLPFPGGLVHEHLHEGFYSHHEEISCALYSLNVSDEAYEKALKLTEEMFSKADCYHYSLWGLVKCRRGVEYERENFFFCSQFIAKVLEESGALCLPKPSSLMRPMDYESLPQLKCEYKGELKELKKLLLEKNQNLLFSYAANS